MADIPYKIELEMDSISTVLSELEEAQAQIKEDSNE